MKVCVLNNGTSHGVHRTIAISKYCVIEAFIEIGNITVHHKALIDRGIRVISLNYKGFAAIKIAHYLKTQTNADYYLCHFANGAHIDACIYAKIRNIAVIAMGSDILNVKISKLKMLKKIFVLREVNYISCKSIEILQTLKRWRVKSEMSINYWGVNKEHFFYIPEISAKNALGLSNSTTIFLSSRIVGRLYNIHLIAKAFVKINAIIDNTLFVFAGRIADSNYLAEIEGIFAENRLANYLFLGEIDKEKISQYYNASSIVYSFSEREGFPNTIFEVFACRSNLICGDITSLRNFFDRNQAGFKLCSFDVNCIVEHTLNILSDGQYSNQQKENNYRIYKEFGDLNINARKFCEDLKKNVHPGGGKMSSIIILFFLDILQIVSKKLKFIILRAKYSSN